MAAGGNLSSYKGTWTVAEDGKVLINGSMIFVAEGYTPVSHIDEFAGYYVNGDDVVKIVVADGKATVLVNGVDVKAKANWNGTVLTYSAKDIDAVSAYQDRDRVYTVTLVDGNIVITHECIQDYDDMDYEFITETKNVTYTAAEEPAESDAFAGTWVYNSFKFIVDGKGTVTDEDGNKYTYTIDSGKMTFEKGYYTVECEIKNGKLSAFYDDGDGDSFTNEFTKQA